jgi:hypothetical protein
MHRNFSNRGERVTQIVVGLEEDTAYQLKVVVKEKNAPAFFENTKTVHFKTCKVTSAKIKRNRILEEKFDDIFSEENSSDQVWMSGKLICFPWEKSSNECPINSCTVNGGSVKNVSSNENGDKCCEIDEVPHEATDYEIEIFGPKSRNGRARDQKLKYTSPRTNKISRLSMYIKIFWNGCLSF